MLRSSLAAALLAAALALPAAGAVDGFPRPNEIFPVLVADPRHVQISASYYRLDGGDRSDLALGHSWGLARDRGGPMLDRQWEADVEAMAFSRFKIGGGVNEFETVDFYAGLPFTARRGDASLRTVLFHESSHLGDDYIRRTGTTGFRHSEEGLRVQAALEPWEPLRLYGGGGYLLHTVPAPERWSGQCGAELTGRDLGWARGIPVRPFLAEDLQWHERAGWNMDSRLVAGVMFGFRESPSRAMRVQAGWFDGHSPYGQFRARREHWADLSVAFEL